MPARRSCVLGFALLTLIFGSANALLSARAPAERLRLEADRQGPHGSVLILNNCDASYPPQDGKRALYPDNCDCTINGPPGSADWQQVEPIKIRQADVRSPVVLRLANDAPTDIPAIDKVRIFNAEGRAILGRGGHPILRPNPPADCPPQLSDRYTLSADELRRLSRGDLTLYAEGLQFAVAARLELYAGDRKQDELLLYVAPFLVLPHTQLPRWNMVVRTQRVPGSCRYADTFAAKVRRATELDPALARLEPRVLEVDHPDVWMEDELQWGYTQTPRCRLDVAMHTHRNRPLAEQIRALLGPGTGYFEAFDYRNADGDSVDFGGNLECTPPTPRWPFGRVYYGSVPARPTPGDHGTYVETYRRPGDGAQRQHAHMSDGFRAFFRRQKRHPSDAVALQEPIELCTNWLAVGHIDEILSFVPANTKRGFVLLWASPRLGLRLLREADASSADGSVTGLDERYARYGVRTLRELLDLDPLHITSAELLDMSFEDYNEAVEDKIRANVNKLKDELGLDENDLRPIPVVFCNALAEWRGVGTWEAIALTPGMVNLSCMGHVCLVPDPFIQPFRNQVLETMAQIGEKALFIDDWEVYHAREGEVHCGSNMLREPFARPWWREPQGGSR